jgi:hypothetical protein
MSTTNSQALRDDAPTSKSPTNEFEANPGPYHKRHTEYAEYKAWVASGGLQEFQKSAGYDSLSELEIYCTELKIVPGLREAMRAEKVAYYTSMHCTMTTVEDAMALIRELEGDSSDTGSGSGDKIVSPKTHN